MVQQLLKYLIPPDGVTLFLMAHNKFFTMYSALGHVQLQMIFFVSFFFYYQQEVSCIIRDISYVVKSKARSQLLGHRRQEGGLRSTNPQQGTHHRYSYQPRLPMHLPELCQQLSQQLCCFNSFLATKDKLYLMMGFKHHSLSNHTDMYVQTLDEKYSFDISCKE